MTSEIRVNKLTNRVGLGTVEYTNTGIVVSGISTSDNFKTGTSNLHSTGLNIFDLDVDGHTNLDNGNVAGIVTFNSGSALHTNGGQILLFDRPDGNSNNLFFGTGGKAVIYHDGTNFSQVNNTGHFYLGQGVGNKDLYLYAQASGNVLLQQNTGVRYVKGVGSDASVQLFFNNNLRLNTTTAGVSIPKDLDVDGHTNLDNVSISGITTSNQINISSSGPRITFSDSNENPDFYIEVNASQFLIQDATANAQRFRIQSNGVVDIDGNTNFSGGIDVTGGPITATGSEGKLSLTNTGSNATEQIATFLTSNSGTHNRIVIKTSTNNGGNPYIKFDAGGQDMVVGTRYEGTTNNLLVLGPALDPDNASSGIFVKGTGAVGFGTDIMDSSANLSITDTGSARIYMKSGDSADCSLIFGSINDTATGAIRYDHSDDTFRLYGYNNAQRLTITSGGQVVVGGTSSQASDAVTLMPDGEVTAAGFYFSNNIGSAMNNTGIRRATTNTMVFDTASTERLRIDGDGNTSTKGSLLEHFVCKKVQAIAQNGNYVQYVLVCPTGTNDVRLQGKFHFTRATGTSGNAQQTVEAQLMTNNTGGDAQYYVRTASTDEGSYSGMYYRWVTCEYNSTTYYALEGHPITGSSYWGGFMQHGVFTGTANACSNLGTVLNTGSHSISNITALTARKAHERWYNTNLNVQAGGLYVKQASGLNGGYFAPTYYDVNQGALPTQMKVHGQKAVCIDCTRYYTSGDIITFRINNDYEGAIYVSPTGVNYNSTSDYRLKENVIDLTGAIDRVKQLKPKRFNFIKDPGNTMDGFMAHEVSGIVPNAVMGEKDAVKDILYEENDEVIPEGKKIGDVKEKDAIDPQTMDDSKLVPLLTAALQEAITKIETLETKVAALEGS